MTAICKNVGRLLRRLHQDEGGAEGLEKLLIIAAVVLPLLGLLIIFRNDLSDWVNQIWGDMKGSGQNYNYKP